MDLSEAMLTQRAIRHFSDKSVPDETIKELLLLMQATDNYGDFWSSGIKQSNDV